MELSKAIEGRRSIRRFKCTPVPRDDIEKMVYAASMAPSGGNLQPWRFLAITGAEIDTLTRIVHDEGVSFFHKIGQSLPQLIVSSLVFSTAPLVFAVLMKPFPLEGDSWFTEFLKERNIQGRTIEVYGGYVDSLSVGAAIENLILTAYDLGYGSCWVRIPYYAKDKLEESLRVEPPWEIIALVPVGIPDVNPRKPPRKGVEEILTYYESHAF